MENKGLMLSIDKLPLIEEAFASIENMEKFCNKILESRLAPDHFYEKKPGTNDRDYTKGNTAAVMMVLIQGNQLHLPVLTALQQIVPVNGLLSIKGDGAKSIILSSGKVQTGSWIEKEEGSIDGGDLKVTISAERSDTHEKMSRSFSVAQAKRAGLWITESMISGQDGWKWKKSSWYKYPERMIKYRALGFLARDLYPDVMAGTYTTEEAMDIPQETAEVIETTTGAKITIPDKDHAQKRAGKLTERVAEKIPENKFGEVKNESIQEAIIVETEKKEVSKESLPTEESPFIPSKGSVETFNGQVTKIDGIPIDKTEHQPEEIQLTSEQMEKMDSKELLHIINENMEMMEANELIPGKNTNKKLRAIILAWQEGRLTEYTASFLSEEKGQKQDNTSVIVNDDLAEIKPNKDFDKQKSDKEADEFLNAPSKTKEQFNKYAMEVPPFDKGNQREFGTTKKLFNALLMLEPPINNIRFLELGAKLNILDTYKDKESFVKYAPVEQINLLLNAN